MVKQSILVIGGAGYIGSVCSHKLIEEGHNVIVFDNLSKGLLTLIPNRAKFIKGDICDERALDNLFSSHVIDAVIHFAAAKDAGESMKVPSKYVDNIQGTCNILKAMEKYNVTKIVYSSSAAVYGALQKEGLVDETHPTEPLNFYGFSKLEGERLIKWYCDLKKFSGVCLRYFNVAGDGGLYYVDPNAKNIFPILAEVLSGKRKQLEIFGSDYKTQDGTGVRDYIHVIDLVDAHIKALSLSGSFQTINLGSQKGYSVLELVKAFEKASKKKLPYIMCPRREGDPALLVASSQKAKMLLNWEAKHTLDQMVESTLRAYKKSLP